MIYGIVATPQELISYVEMATGDKNWRRKGFNRFVNKVLVCNSRYERYGWLPDAWRPLLRQRIIEVIEVGLNSNSKWDAILDIQGDLDCEFWNLRIYCVDKDIPKIQILEAGKLMTMWFAKLKQNCVAEGANR